MFENFWGNRHVVEAIGQMIAQDRLAQTLLFSGPEGVGKATLARRLGAGLLGHAELIERDDLSLEDNRETVAARERWPSEKRNEDPLLFATHPDFVTFAPDGPLRQISIQQTRLLKERAQFLPHHGKRRIFVIDHVDRANEQAANSLLKILEEPPDHLILIMTAENAYDLLPTIRSRSVPFHFAPLAKEELRAFVQARKLEKFESYLKVLYELLRDVLILREDGGEIRNQDIRRELEALAARLEFEWIRKAVARVDEIVELIRRNIQKTIALDALVVELRAG
jgi:DNA polymerase-3 subunit delta'